MNGKWQEFRQACKAVRAAYAEFNKQEKHFGCLANKNLVCAGDPCDNNGQPPRRCGRYNLNVHCTDVTCPYREWNKMHYDTYNRLCDAWIDAFGAFLNLFVIERERKR